MRVSTGADVSYAPSIEQSTTISRCGKGRERSRDFGGGLGSYGSRQGVDKGPSNISIAGGTTTSQKSAERSLVALNGHS